MDVPCTHTITGSPEDVVAFLGMEIFKLRQLNSSSLIFGLFISVGRRSKWLTSTGGCGHCGLSIQIRANSILDSILVAMILTQTLGR